MLRTLAALLLLALSLPLPTAGQENVTEMELRTLMNEQRYAVDLYREGRLEEALASVRGRSASMNHVIAERILRWLESPVPQLRDANEKLIPPWNAQLVAALAALHMEMALRVYTERGSVDAYHTQVRTARMLFDAATNRDGSRR